MTRLQETPQFQDFKIDSDKHNLLAKRSSLAEPIRIGTTISEKTERPLSPESNSMTRQTHSATLSASFASVSGFVFQQSLDLDAIDSKNVKTSQLDSQNILTRRYQLSSNLKYDIVKGGSKSLLAVQRNSEAATANRDRYSVWQSLYQLNTQLYGQLVNLYVGMCKLEILEIAKAPVAKAAEVGKVQLNANLISQIEYLNYVNLTNQLSRQQVTRRANVANLLNAFYTYGEKLHSESAKLKVSEATCQVNINELTSTVNRFAISKKLANDRLQIKIAESDLTIAKIGLESQRLQAKGSIQPFVSYDWIPEVGATRESGSTTIGVEASWPISNSRAFSASDQRVLEVKESINKLAIAKLSANATKIDFEIQKQNILSRLEIALVNLDSSEELLSVMRKTQKLGRSDSLSYANAVQSKISAEETILDLWGEFMVLKHDHYAILKHSESAEEVKN